MEIIRESRGMAKDYAPLVLELYEKKNGNAKPVKYALENLDKDAKYLKAEKDQREILLSYKSDPFPDKEVVLEINTEAKKIITENATRDVTREAIEILMANELRFSILTEKAENALQHFDIIKEYKKARYGTKLLSNANGNRLNLEDSPLFFSIESLKEANKRGINASVTFHFA